MVTKKKIDGWTVVKPGRLEDEMYKVYSELFTTGETTSNTYVAKLIQRDFKALMTKNTDDAIKVLTVVNKLMKDTADYYNKQEANDAEYSEYLINKNLLDWQKNVIQCTSKRITMCAGRRAGKSFVDAALMIIHCLTGTDVITLPDGRVVEKARQAIYIGLTLEKAKAIIWQILLDLIDKCKIKVKRIDNGLCKIDFSNGASIQLLGNNSKAEREKIRGFDSSMFIIDECQSQQGLLYLIDSIISPIVKGRDGVIILTGTAPLSAGTFWENAIKGDNWFHFHATMEDNTTIPNYEKALEDVLRENNWTKDNITFRREYLGEIAYDTNLLIYPKRTYETDSNFPKSNRFKECWIGLDYGFRDSTALAPILIDEEGNGWIRHEFKKEGMSATSIVDTVKAKIEFIKKTYNIPEDKIYVIQDINEKSISADMYNQGVKQIRDAKKLGESYQIAIVRDSLESGKLNIEKDSFFDNECNRLVYKYNSENNTVIYEIDDATYHGDICDAVKYAWSSYMTYSNYLGGN